MYCNTSGDDANGDDYHDDDTDGDDDNDDDADDDDDDYGYDYEDVDNDTDDDNEHGGDNVAFFARSYRTLVCSSYLSKKIAVCATTRCQPSLSAQALSQAK